VLSYLTAVKSESLNKYKKAIAEMFDARSWYSRSEIHSRLADRLVRLGSPQPNERVLDIATGTGFVAIPAARLVGERGTVIGVDISPGMLDQAAKAVATAGVGNVELVQADAEALDYPADSFDLIFCCNALPYMTDVPAALRHWHSLLRPGGRLAFNCWAEHSYATGHLLRIIAAKHGIRVAEVGQNTGTPERCRSLLTAVGFAQPEIVTEPTATFFTLNHLEAFPDMAVKNPLYGITPNDASRLSGLHDEYIAEARSPSVQKAIDAEVGAYFVLAHKPPALPSRDG
jgi:ubiquinone/menaquinone biosynthesis C-methylase UbiE